MHDWTRDDTYAFTSELSPPGFAFEFLRRNLTYREDFIYIAALRRHLAATHGQGSGAYLTHFNDPAAWITLPSKFDEQVQLDADWRDATVMAPDGQHRIRLEDFCSLKWGLAQPLVSPYCTPTTAPRFRPWVNFPFLPSWREIDVFFYGEDVGESETDPAKLTFIQPLGQRIGMAVVVFDLSRPLTGQIANAEQYLRSRAATQREAGVLNETHDPSATFYATKLRILLRVLDGIEAGAKKAEIWRVACKLTYHSKNPTATVNDLLNQATRLIEFRYRLLADSLIVPKSETGVADS